VILQVVKDDQFADAVVLKAALHNGLLEVTIKSEYLFVKLYPGWLELFNDLSFAKGVLELSLR